MKMKSGQAVLHASFLLAWCDLQGLSLTPTHTHTFSLPRKGRRKEAGGKGATCGWGWAGQTWHLHWEGTAFLPPPPSPTSPASSRTLTLSGKKMHAFCAFYMRVKSRKEEEEEKGGRQWETLGVEAHLPICETELFHPKTLALSVSIYPWEERGIALHQNSSPPSPPVQCQWGWGIQPLDLALTHHTKGPI